MEILTAGKRDGGLSDLAHKVNRPVVGSGGTMIGVITDSAIPTVARSISRTILRRRGSRFVGLPVRLDENPIFSDHHHLTPSLEGWTNLKFTTRTP